MTRPTVELLDLPLPEEPAARQRLLRERRAALRRQAWDQMAERWGRRGSAVYGWCYAGVVRTLQLPFYTLDLLDRHGKPDYSKLCPFIVCQELIAIQAWDVVKNGRTLQPSVVIIIAVLAYASATLMREFIAHVRAKYFGSDSTAAETRMVEVNETHRIIEERRDRAAGVEPTP